VTSQTRRRVLGAASLAIALTSVAVVRAVLTHPAEPPRSAATGTPAMVVGHAHGAYAPYPTDTEPMFILVLGSDARPGEAVERARSDAIHIVGVNFRRHRASVIDIPRDSWVPIPGHGFNKINAAMAGGGVPLAVQTVEALTGIRFDYFALTSFPGVRSMVDDIGGLRIRVPYDIHDPTDGGPSIPRGIRTLDGSSALAFARARHFVPGGDFGRTRNQGAMLIAALKQYQGGATGDLTSMLSWLGTFMRNVDTDVPLEELMSLAYAAALIPSTSVNNVALEGSTGYEGTQSVVHLSTGSEAVFADIRSDGVVDHATNGGGSGS
jgi:polyisoprenyl-teichoic acid--peptidoglycan teichoic acid transferase